MSAHSIGSAVRRGPARSAGGSASAAADFVPSYHLDVVGIDIADIVESAGGWLFDRAMAGWDVRVTLTRDEDVRPLRILGVRTDPRVPQPPPPVALAASVQALLDTPELGADLAVALRRRQAEVTVWGTARLAALDSGARSVIPVRHVLSGAARAFKAQALVAAGLDARGVGAVEMFRTGNRSLLPVPPDLSPA